jgi:hypothetical protein
VNSLHRRAAVPIVGSYLKMSYQRLLPAGAVRLTHESIDCGPAAG